MLDRYGALVMWAINSLSMAERTAKGESEPSSNMLRAATGYDGFPDALRVALHRTRQLCVLSDWDSLEPAIERLERRSTYVDRSVIAAEVAALRFRLQDDLTNEYFFHLTPADVPLYLNAEPFGAAVSVAFPEAIEDIAEASKCLALQRPTACVFHLMRVMELAVWSLAKKLKVTSIDPKVDFWYKIADHVNKAINALPAQSAKEKARKAKFGAAVAHLNSVRIAWRNDVMHPKQSYSREEAHTIFAAAKAFMADVAALK